MPTRKAGASFSPVTGGISKQLSHASEHSHVPASEVRVPRFLQRGSLKAAAHRLPKLLNRFYEVLLSPVKELVLSWSIVYIEADCWHCSPVAACLASGLGQGQGGLANGGFYIQVFQLGRYACVCVVASPAFFNLMFYIDYYCGIQAPNKLF